MTPFDQVRKIFPNFPEEIFALWLDEKIGELGWPPAGTDWDRSLVGYPILYWKKLKWVRQDIPLTFERLGPLSRKTINGLMETNVLEKYNQYSDSVKNTKARFDAIFKTVIDTREIPGTLVLLDEGSFYEILSGDHRVSVMCALRQFPEFKKYVPERVSAWIGYLDPAFKKLFGKE
jgi:hypothetical protein